MEDAYDLDRRLTGVLRPRVVLSTERRLTPERGGQATPLSAGERRRAVEADVVMMSAVLLCGCPRDPPGS